MSVACPTLAGIAFDEKPEHSTLHPYTPTMNRTQIDVAIFLVLVAIAVAIAYSISGASSIEVQLHDIDIVIDKLSFTILILAPLASLVFLPIAAMRRFNSISTNAGLIVGLVLAAVLCYSAIELQTNYLLQANKMSEGALPEKLISNIGWGINLARAFFAIISLCALALIYHTVKIWKAAHSNSRL